MGYSVAEIENTVNALCDVEHSLTVKQIEFIDDMWETLASIRIKADPISDYLTEKQIDYIVDLYDAKCCY